MYKISLCRQGRLANKSSDVFVKDFKTLSTLAYFLFKTRNKLKAPYILDELSLKEFKILIIKMESLINKYSSLAQ